MSSITQIPGEFCPLPLTLLRAQTFFSGQVTQEVSHPATTPKRASKLAAEEAAAEPKSATTAVFGDTSASALAAERPAGLTRSVSQPIERDRGAATRKVTLFERCTTTMLESSSSGLSIECGIDDGEKV